MYVYICLYILYIYIYVCVCAYVCVHNYVLSLKRSLRVRSLVVSDLHQETKGSRLKSGC